MAEYSASPFPAPRPQDLSSLARKIQFSENKHVHSEIFKNPRLLALSTDVPTILQEGFRYNGLHVAARYGNHDAVKTILSNVSGPSFMEKLYPDDVPQSLCCRTKYLTDLYLNAPEKGFLETPLHFACKFGHYEAAKLLAEHPLCDMTLRNKENKTAFDIICSRARGANLENHQKIKNLFLHTKIVPIWRDCSSQSPAAVGIPVNPKYLGEYTPKSFCDSYGDISLDMYGPADKSCVPRTLLGGFPEIRAYAGPMDDDTAAQFYSAMKGSSTFIQLPTGSAIKNEGPRTPRTPPATKPVLTPPSAALASIPSGNITPEMKRSKSEYVTPPSTPKCPITSNLLSPTKFQYTPQTLSLLLMSPGTPVPRVQEVRQARLKDPEKGMECMARQHAAACDIPWSEYWIFLGDFTDLSSSFGLVLMEDYLSNRRNELYTYVSPAMSSPLNTLCEGMQNLNLGRNSDMGFNTGETTWPSDDTKPKVKRPEAIPSTQEEIYALIRRLFPMPGQSTSSSESTEPPTDPPNSLPTAPPTEQSDPPTDPQTDSPTDPQTDSPTEDKGSILKLKYGKELNLSMTKTDSSFDDDDDESIHNWRTPRNSFSTDRGSSDETESDNEWDTSAAYDRYLDCFPDSLFLHGTSPSQEDFQARCAMGHLIDTLPETVFPEIITWFNCLKALGNTKQ